MSHKRKIMLLQTRYIESISYLSTELVKAFPRDRYEITMVYLESDDSSATFDCVDECFSLGLSKFDYKGLRLKAIAKLRSFLKGRHFDVIIANMYKPVNLLMQLRKQITASLCIGIIHAFGEFDRLGRRWAMRWMIDSRWRIVAVSQPLKDYLIRANCGLNAGNTLVINNAIDVKSVISQAMEKVDARFALKLPADGIVFGTVGRSVKGKRQLELIKAFHQFSMQYSGVYLAILGDGELRAELTSYVAQHQLQSKVHLVGYVPQAAKYLRALDVFVFPSESEGFGVALLEAMALSLPTIVNRVEPLQSIVANAGIIVDSSDIDVLANALAQCYQLSPSVSKQKGMENCLRVRECYDIEAYRNAYYLLVDNHFSVVPLH